MWKRIAWIGLVATLAPAQNDTVIRVNTRLVEVDVVVRDHGNPVGGLRQRDFTILDNGKQQRISEFHAKTKRIVQEVRSLPARAVANRANTLGEEPVEATVLLWDVINTQGADQAWVLQQVLQYLKSMRPGERIALYRLTQSLKVLQDFTDDPGRLRLALTRVSPEQSANLSAGNLGDTSGKNPLPVDDGSNTAAALIAAIQDVNASQDAATVEMQMLALRDRALITFNALRTIADHLGGLRGRKKLIWLSSAFPAIAAQGAARFIGATGTPPGGTPILETLDVNFQLQKAVQQLNEAHVAVYPIDARGLTFTNSSQGFGANNPAGTMTGALMNPGYDTMNILAIGTGGRATYADNDVPGAMRRVLDDFNVSYTIGFYPSDDKLDGSYHKLDVKVNRKGADLRHRTGYFAPDVKVATEQDRRFTIDRAMQNELDSTGIGLMGKSTAVKTQEGFYVVDMTIDAHDLLFKPQEDHWVAPIEYATYFSKTPKLVGTVETMEVTLTEDRLREVLTNGLTMTRAIFAGDEEGRLRIVIEDRGTGKVGSVWIPIH